MHCHVHQTTKNTAQGNKNNNNNTKNKTKTKPKNNTYKKQTSTKAATRYPEGGTSKN